MFIHRTDMMHRIYHTALKNRGLISRRTVHEKRGMLPTPKSTHPNTQSRSVFKPVEILTCGGSLARTFHVGHTFGISKFAFRAIRSYGTKVGESMGSKSSQRESSSNKGGLLFALAGLAVGAGGAFATFHFTQQDQNKSGPLASSQMSTTFEKHASVCSRETGELAMTYDDFMRSLLPSGAQIESGAKERCRRYFNLADTDGDGTISFSEYAIFRQMLRTPEAVFRVAFGLFDVDGDGMVTKSEFMQVLDANRHDPSLHFDFDCEFVKRAFGVDGSRSLNYRQFVTMVKGLREEVLMQEFKHYAGNSDHISAENLRKLLALHAPKLTASYDLGVKAEKSQEGYTFEEFQALQTVVDNLDDLEVALVKMLGDDSGHAKSSCKDGISRDDLRRVVHQSTGHALTSTELDMVFSIFDVNHNGCLDEESFMYVLKQRKSRFGGGSEEGIEEPKRKLSLIETLTLGGASASVGATAVFPLDKIKTRVQSAHKPQPILASIKDTFKDIIRREGARGLYKGLGPQLVGITPEKAVKITVNDYLRRYFQARNAADGNTDQHGITLMQEALAGLGTGICQVVITNPYEVVKIRLQMQADPSQRKSMFQVARELGIRGMYTGLGATMLRDIPFNILYFSSYAYLKQSLADEQGRLSTSNLVIAGLVAGGFAAGLDTPADSLKTRLQNGEGKYKGVMDAIRTITREEGAGAFFRGLGPRILIIGPLFSITFTTFATLQSLLFPDTVVPVASLEADLQLARGTPISQVEHHLANLGIRVGPL